MSTYMLHVDVNRSQVDIIYLASTLGIKSDGVTPLHVICLGQLTNKYHEWL